MRKARRVCTQQKKKMSGPQMVGFIGCGRERRVEVDALGRAAALEGGFRQEMIAASFPNGVRERGRRETILLDLE
jgi:hypothetical protein